jgi:hypothetical protein
MKKNQRATHIRVALTLTLCTFSISLAASEINVNPPADKAALVVYRPAKVPGTLFQDNIDLHLAYDEQRISTVSKGRHFVFYAWPGAHKFEPSFEIFRMSSDRCGSSTIHLDVKAGETYYIKVTPPEGPPPCPSGASLMPMDTESAQKELADSKPVDWAKDVVEGTLAEVHPIGAQVEGGAQCSPVQWIPDIDTIETSSFKRASLRGALFMRDDSLLLNLDLASGDAVPIGVTIPYADIATVEIKNKVLKRIGLIKRKNGRLDSFSVLTPDGIRVDRDQTKACADQLATHLTH